MLKNYGGGAKGGGGGGGAGGDKYRNKKSSTICNAPTGKEQKHGMSHMQHNRKDGPITNASK